MTASELWSGNGARVPCLLINNSIVALTVWRREAVSAQNSRGGTIPEITMRYVSRYLSHDTIRITILHRCLD